MMYKFSNLFQMCLFTLLCVAVTSCTGYWSMASKPRPVRHKFPVKSFVQISQETLWQGCELDKETKKEKCQKAVMRAVSSGAWVSHSEIDNSISYVLTAGHSCKSTYKPPATIASVKVTHLGQKFTIIDFNGFKYSGSVVATEKTFDTCLLSASNVYIKPPILRVASEEPKRGELFYNMAAPHGIVSPRMVLTFDGYFAGYSPKGYAIYTIPTKPGSSGSAIVNIQNQLVGIIFAGYRSMENIGVASPLVAIKVFLKNSITKAEMEVWSLANKNNDKTSTSMTREFQRLQKKLDDFFIIPTVYTFSGK